MMIFLLAVLAVLCTPFRQDPTTDQKYISFDTKLMGVNGETGQIYASIDQFWRNKDQKLFNQDSIKFFESRGSSDDEIIGDIPGLAQKFNPIQIEFNSLFLNSLHQSADIRFDSAIDVGAGNGRMTRQFLKNRYRVVDLVERDQHSLQQARRTLQNNSHVRNFYHSSLQQFKFEHKYDLIWVSGVLMFLSQIDNINFLKKAKEALNEDGVIIVKETLPKGEIGFFYFPNQSFTYLSPFLWKRIFSQAGLRLVQSGSQKPFSLVPWKKMSFALQIIY